MKIETPYLLFLGDAPDELAVKTARGVLQWRPERCLAQHRLPGCRVDLGLPEWSAAEAAARGARTLVIGVANAGGVLPDRWHPALQGALTAGLDIASGMHTHLASVPALAQAARRHRRQLHELREVGQPLRTGTGARRSGRRVLTVGTDCSVGKKYTALAIEGELCSRGVAVDFRATGQTGILIAGEGIAIDAVVSDFISGAAEALSPAAAPDHWDVVEGQGSLFHPSFAGVSLGLLHGTQPDAFVVCHVPTRTRMRGVEQPLPSVADCIEATLAAGRLTNPEIRCVGAALDTSRDRDPARALAELAAQIGLPVVDPLVTGVGPLVDRMLALS